MSDVRKWPLDYDELEQGQVIPKERLRDIVRETPGTEPYKLAYLELASNISREMMARKGSTVLALVRKSAIRILTTEEAAEYLPPRFEQLLRSLGVVHVKASTKANYRRTCVSGSAKNSCGNAAF